MNKLSLLFLAIILSVPSTVFSQRSGSFGFDGFGYGRKQANQTAPPSKYQEIIKKFDKDKDGKLSTEERAEARKSFYQSFAEQRHSPQSLRGWYNKRGQDSPATVCRCGCKCCRTNPKSDRGRGHGPSRGRGHSRSRHSR